MFPSHDLVSIKFREYELMGDPNALFSGVKKITLKPHWNSKGHICIRQREPLPMKILSIALDTEVSDV